MQKKIYFKLNKNSSFTQRLANGNVLKSNPLLTCTSGDIKSIVTSNCNVWPKSIIMIYHDVGLNFPRCAHTENVSRTVTLNNILPFPHTFYYKPPFTGF